jgi:hypothetical protein
MRLLDVIAELARKPGRWLAIHAEADEESDRPNVADKARERANAIKKYLEKPGAVIVPPDRIDWQPQSGMTSEPYQRIARIYLLEPCKADAKPKGTGLLQGPERR